jgi:hypothetical protein
MAGKARVPVLLFPRIFFLGVLGALGEKIFSWFFA